MTAQLTNTLIFYRSGKRIHSKRVQPESNTSVPVPSGSPIPSLVSSDKSNTRTPSPLSRSLSHTMDDIAPTKSPRHQDRSTRPRSRSSSSTGKRSLISSRRKSAKVQHKRKREYEAQSLTDWPPRRKYSIMLANS